MITMLNCDCMEYMKTLPDKAFELAIVDPPYGDAGGGAMGRGETGTLRRVVRPVQYRKVNHAFGGRFDRYNIGKSIMPSAGGSTGEPHRRDVEREISDSGRPP